MHHKSEVNSIVPHNITSVKKVAGKRKIRTNSGEKPVHKLNKSKQGATKLKTNLAKRYTK